jgi:hypothetical protein
LDRADNHREIDVALEEWVCMEAVMFTKWKFGAGVYMTGPHKGQHKPLLQARVGKRAFFTSKSRDMTEDQRIVIGAYEIGALESDGQLTALAGTGIRVRNINAAPRFWDFYQNRVGLPAWGAGLFRYLSDEQADRMYQAVQLAAS